MCGRCSSVPCVQCHAKQRGLLHHRQLPRFDTGRFACKYRSRGSMETRSQFKGEPSRIQAEFLSPTCRCCQSLPRAPPRSWPAPTCRCGRSCLQGRRDSSRGENSQESWQTPAKPDIANRLDKALRHRRLSVQHIEFGELAAAHCISNQRRCHLNKAHPAAPPPRRPARKTR